MFRRARIEELIVREPFESLFDIKGDDLAAIQENMQSHGFDDSKPIDVWKNGSLTVIDGHTRLRAAAHVGMVEVPIFEHVFDDEDVALQHAIANQKNRRNIEEVDLLRIINVVDKRKKRGAEAGGRGNQHSGGKSATQPLPKSTAEQTAKIVGTSPDKVKKARTIIDEAKKDPSVMDRVIKDGKSINSIANEIKEKKKHQAEIVVPEPEPLVLTSESTHQYPPAKFNRTNDNVEWALWTWNPVTGCEHNCVYCYARDIANRFYPEKFKPTFHPERVNAPRHMKVPAAAAGNIGERNVFVCPWPTCSADGCPTNGSTRSWRRSGTPPSGTSSS
jgi:hypothetical protein